MPVMALLCVEGEWVLVLFNQIYIGLILLVQSLLPLQELGSHLLERIDVYALFICHGRHHVMPLAHLVEQDLLVIGARVVSFSTGCRRKFLLLMRHF